jgi:hypothetical protein
VHTPAPAAGADAEADGTEVAADGEDAIELHAPNITATLATAINRRARLVTMMSSFAWAIDGRKRLEPATATGCHGCPDDGRLGDG